jgi:hypothetical protein
MHLRSSPLPHRPRQRWSGGRGALAAIHFVETARAPARPRFRHGGGAAAGRPSACTRRPSAARFALAVRCGLERREHRLEPRDLRDLRPQLLEERLPRTHEGGWAVRLSMSYLIRSMRSMSISPSVRWRGRHHRDCRSARPGSARHLALGFDRGTSRRGRRRIVRAEYRQLSSYGMGAAPIAAGRGAVRRNLSDEMTETGTRARRPRVELLWWSGCPSTPQALSELRTVLGEAGLDPGAVEVRQIETDEQALNEAFAGSPTIRIDGRDVEESSGCRSPARRR